MATGKETLRKLKEARRKKTEVEENATRILSVMDEDTEEETAEEEVAEEPSAGLPSWIVGTSFEDNMEGDPKPGGGAAIRFWMPKGSEKNVVFLSDGSPLCIIWEHNVKLNGKWTNWFSCSQPMGEPCPLCSWADSHEGTFKRYKGAFFSIIDTTEYKDRAGVMQKNNKKLLVAKRDTIEILKRKYTQRVDKDSTLRGAMYDIYRGNSEKSANVGEQFDFVDTVDLSVFDDSEEFDYATLLKPDVEKLQAVVDRLQREEASDSSIDDSGVSY